MAGSAPVISMKLRFDHAQWIGAISIVVALIVLFVWIPLDVETGVVEKVRRRLEIGDALAPTLAGCVLLLSGLLLFFSHRSETATGFVDRANLNFLLQLLLILTLSLILMRWGGEFAVLIAQAAGSDVSSYRNLRDTAPWKYIGFFLGGVSLIAGLVYLVERRINFRAVLIAVGVTLLMIVIYDLPFDDLLLPPNGDV